MKSQELIETSLASVLGSGEASAHASQSIGDTITDGWQRYCRKISAIHTLSQAKSLDNKELANFIRNSYEVQGMYQESGLLIREGDKLLCIEESDKAEGHLSKSYVMPVLIKSGRPGIPAKTLVVLKVIPFSVYTPIGYVHVNETAPYARLSSLEGICDFYPKIYGVYIWLTNKKSSIYQFAS